MRAILGMVGLIAALAVGAVLMKKQLGMHSAVPAQAAPAAAQTALSSDGVSGLTIQAQARQLPAQIKHSVESSMQQRRAVPED